MLTADFEYNLPEDLIAQAPIEPRDHSRLMTIDRKTGIIEHHHFGDLPGFLKAGDLLVFNDSRVIPARLVGRKESGTARAEVLLLRRIEPGLWEALVKPGKRLKTGAVIRVANASSGTDVPATSVSSTGVPACVSNGVSGTGIPAADGGTGVPACGTRQSALAVEIVADKATGVKIVRLSDESLLPTLGIVPLPPYIHAPLADPDRYQTIYARVNGSVAAPTAGLHFTPGLLQTLEAKGVETACVTLHIGLDTFRPVPEEEAETHVIHKEYAEVPAETAERLNRAVSEGRRIVAVGTTSVRVLEGAASLGLPLKPFAGEIGLFILPGFRFLVVDAMITNFHLPRSTLLMLVSAFAGRELILRAYDEAIARRYRFYSFGDAMFII